MSRLPDFIVIGAMKCATSSLHDQLARQHGISMSDPKEPCFFSDDDRYEQGIDWYAGLFAAASESSLVGESSTHYTKLPTYPKTLERMQRHLPDARLLYVMREPIERIVSQYVHEWSERTVPDEIELGIRECPRLVDYSRYAMQLEPFLEAYGEERVLPVFMERLRRDPQAELERICAFVGYRGTPRWVDGEERHNVSRRRLRKSALRDAVVWNPLVTTLRRRLVSQGLRDRVKRLWQMRERPVLSGATRERLAETLDRDLEILGRWLGARLTCETFKEVVTETPLDFPCRAGTAA